MRLTGLQKQVLRVYRKALRCAAGKDAEIRADNVDFVKREFRKNRDIDKRDFRRIEHFVRKAEKMIKLMGNPNTSISIKR